MKFCVIGLGRFGYHVATTLAENGMEVLGIDRDETIVSEVKDLVTQAVTMHIQSEESLRSLGVDSMDTVIVAMGENFAESILVTALLKKKIGIKTVITRAINDIHKEILLLVGADQIILPEKDIGIKLADKLSAPFTEMIRITEDFSLTQLETPERFVGKTLRNLNLFDHYQVRCIGLQQGEDIIPIGLDYTIKENDRLILAGKNNALKAVAAL